MRIKKSAVIILMIVQMLAWNLGYAVGEDGYIHPCNAFTQTVFEDCGDSYCGTVQLFHADDFHTLYVATYTSTGQMLSIERRGYNQNVETFTIDKQAAAYVKIFLFWEDGGMMRPVHGDAESYQFGEGLPTRSYYENINRAVILRLQAVSGELGTALFDEAIPWGAQTFLLTEVMNCINATISLQQIAMIDKAFVKKSFPLEIAKVEAYWEQIQTAGEQGAFQEAIIMNFSSSTVEWLMDFFDIPIQ